MEKYTFLTINQSFFFEIPKIKGSRFLWYVFPIQTKEDFEKQLEEIKKEHFSATHHCYAYKYDCQCQKDLFGIPHYLSLQTRANDDGEPSNTAWKPILSVLDGENLHNLGLIVVRYFWGTLLGVGGLIQAYSQAAKETIAHASIIEQEMVTNFEITSTYDQISLLSFLFKKYEIKILNTTYETDTSWKITQRLQINQGFFESFQKELFDKSKGTLMTKK